MDPACSLHISKDPGESDGPDEGPGGDFGSHLIEAVGQRASERLHPEAPSSVFSRRDHMCTCAGQCNCSTCLYHYHGMQWALHVLSEYACQLHGRDLRPRAGLYVYTVSSSLAKQSSISTLWLYFHVHTSQP